MSRWLAVHLKKTDRVSFKPVLAEFIRTVFKDDPCLYDADLITLDSCREEIMQIPILMSSVQTLVLYGILMD
jgi:hypothetical protein